MITSTFAAMAAIVGGLGADFFASHQLTLALTWTGGHQDVTVQVLNFHSWTFFFGITCILGLYSLYRLSFVERAGGASLPACPA